jgi:hypothetical protein
LLALPEKQPELGAELGDTPDPLRRHGIGDMRTGGRRSHNEQTIAGLTTLWLANVNNP